MTPTFRDLSELVLAYQRGVDYDFIVRDRGAAITVAAIHAGGIEPLTGELAEAIAADDHNLYQFVGIRRTGNDMLRIPEGRFDEMRLRALMQRSRLGVSILGGTENEPLVRLGGANRRMRQILEDQLTQAGIEVRRPAGVGAAHDPSRFVNQPSEGGVQLAASRGLRALMVAGSLDAEWRQSERWQELFFVFANIVRSAITHYAEEVRSDPNLAMKQFEDRTEDVLKAVRRRPPPRRDT